MMGNNAFQNSSNPVKVPAYKIEGTLYVCKSFFSRFKKKHVKLEGNLLKFSKYKRKIDRNTLDLTHMYVEPSVSSRKGFKIITQSRKIKFKAKTT